MRELAEAEVVVAEFTTLCRVFAKRADDCGRLARLGLEAMQRTRIALAALEPQPAEAALDRAVDRLKATAARYRDVAEKERP